MQVCDYFRSQNANKSTYNTSNRHKNGEIVNF